MAEEIDLKNHVLLYIYLITDCNHNPAVALKYNEGEETGSCFCSQHDTHSIKVFGVTVVYMI